VLPSGTAKIGPQEAAVSSEQQAPSPSRISRASRSKSAKGANVRIGDVASVRDGYAPQTSLVRATVEGASS